MPPSRGRIEWIGGLIDEYGIRGIVDITWQTCHTFAVEDALLQRQNEGLWPLPHLHVETDYSNPYVEQLKTGIAAFLEMIG